MHRQPPTSTRTDTFLPYTTLYRSPAPGSDAQFAKLSSLPDVPEVPPKALEMVDVLAKGHEATARTARALFPLVEKANDEPSADLLTQRIGVHEQDRKSVVEGKSVSDRVDLGGRRIIKTKNNTTNTKQTQ